MYNKITLTPKIGKIYYENNANTVLVVNTMNGTTARVGSSTDPFFVIVDGVSNLSELVYNNTNNSYKVLNITFASTPSNSANLLSSFYVQFQQVDGTNIGDAIQLSFTTTLTAFPVNTVLSVLVKCSANVYSGTIFNTFNGVNGGTALNSVNISYTALDDNTYNMVIS